MRKSQLISLIILLVLVIILIWVGAFKGQDDGTNNPTATPKTSASETPNNTAGTNQPNNNATPGPTDSGNPVVYPNINEADYSGLSSTKIVFDPNIVSGNASAGIAVGVWESMASYDYIFIKENPGKTVYMTFDVGFFLNTDVILHALSENNIKASFFFSKEFMNDPTKKEEILRIAAAGHIIGTQGSLSDNSELSVTDIVNDFKACEAAYQNIFGSNSRMMYYRPYGGNFSLRSLAVADGFGYTTALYTSKYYSDTQNNTSLRDRTFGSLCDGAVWAINPAKIDDGQPLSQIIADTVGAGYTFKTIDK